MENISSGWPFREGVKNKEIHTGSKREWKISIKMVYILRTDCQKRKSWIFNVGWRKTGGITEYFLTDCQNKSYSTRIQRRENDESFKWKPKPQTVKPMLYRDTLRET